MTAGGTAEIMEGMTPGGRATGSSSSREGFLPIPIRTAPVRSLEGINIYLRTSGKDNAGEPQGAFALYRAEDVTFTDDDRYRLVENGIEFLYIPIADQRRFRDQTESCLADIAADPTAAVSEVSTLVYETSVELINELLRDPDWNVMSPRLGHISKAVTTLVINNDSAFSHLFTASYHDFYTATHLVNVATWMVPVAYTMGFTDPRMLEEICQAGLLHDIGKVYVSEDTLNKKGRLQNDEWHLLKKHPEYGITHLNQYENVPDLVKRVCHQHHERRDGSGYPMRLKGDQIHPVAHLAVVDSFDAMTAFRPFKKSTLGVSDAVSIIMRETPEKYDPEVVKAWLSLLRKADAGPAPAEAVSFGPEDSSDAAEPSGPDTSLGAAAEDSMLRSKLSPLIENRRFPRTRFQCPARVHVLEDTDAGLSERPGMQVVAHNISRGGLGFLSKTPIPVGEVIRAYIDVRAWTRDSLEGACVRCHSYRDGWHQIGMKFSRVGS